MPLENASRSPRAASCRGMYRSRARMLDQPREVGERGVGREHENGERRVLEGVVERPAAEHVPAELRQHRLAWSSA